MKNLFAIVGLTTALGLPAFAQTQTIDIWATGDSTPDAVTLTSMGTDSAGNPQFGFDFTGTTQVLPETFTVNGQTETLNLTTLVYDSDPSVRFAFGVNNDDGSTGYTPYSFTFSTPVTLSPGSYAVSSSIAGSLTKGIDGNTDPVTLKLPSTGGDIMQTFVGASTDAGGKQSAGVDLISSDVSVDPAQGNSQPLNMTGYASPTLDINLSSAVSQISVTTAFQVSNSDSASFTGRFDINAVPEPSSVGLGALCVGMFALLTWRRRRA